MNGINRIAGQGESTYQDVSAVSEDNVSMAEGQNGLNTIKIGDIELLLTVIGGGTAVHLTRQSDPQAPGRGAVHDFYLDSSITHYAPVRRSYDQRELLKPQWAESTLCGRTWVAMIGGEGGPLSEYEESALTPTCKRCLSLMDNYFPNPRADKRLPLVVSLAVDLVLEHGYAEVCDVPGDQQDMLRRQVRASVRKRKGHGSETFVHESMVIIVCKAIHALRAEELSRAAIIALGGLFSGGDIPREAQPPVWHFSWDAWDVD